MLPGTRVQHSAIVLALVGAVGVTLGIGFQHLLHNGDQIPDVGNFGSTDAFVEFPVEADGVTLGLVAGAVSNTFRSIWVHLSRGNSKGCL